MNWSDIISNTANIIAAFTAVISMLFSLITLFLVYYQLREMNRQSHSLTQSIRSATYQSIVDTERELWSNFSTDKEFMKQHMNEFKVVKKYGISSKQLLNISLLCAHYENVYYQFREGGIPKELWPEWGRTIVNNINKPLIQQVWPDIRSWYWEEFSNYVDKELSKISHQTPQSPQSTTTNKSS